VGRGNRSFSEDPNLMCHSNSSAWITQGGSDQVMIALMLAKIAPIRSEDRSNRVAITAHFETNWNNFISAKI
ncbi:MAG: hypothetical protein RPU39_05385, partial [Candidatus Sedimenticola sp. (ex Thyasira tokunagai)]